MISRRDRLDPSRSRVATLLTAVSTLFRIRSESGRGVDLLQRLPRLPAERLAELAGGDSRDVSAVSRHHRLAFRVNSPIVDLWRRRRMRKRKRRD